MAETLLSPVSSPLHSSNPVSSFPIIAIAVIGICATAVLLVTYYIFVIKCCLNWHRSEILRRFSLSIPPDDPLIRHSPEPRGLDSSAIRSIPLIHYKKPTAVDDGENSVHFECAVCLSEFHEDEQLRKIPKCSHLFHIDCIDVWLQNNSNCPICRTTISNHPHPLSGGVISTADMDFVVIEFGNTHEQPPERLSSGELPSVRCNSNSPWRFGRRVHLQTPKNVRLKKMTSMDDECIDIRNKDDEFSVQAMRRSFSMDSSADRQLYLAIQEGLQLQQNTRVDNAVSGSPIESCSSGSGRVRRSLFSFGHGRRSRAAVLPVFLER